jgi:hypothetical protein
VGCLSPSYWGTVLVFISPYRRVSPGFRLRSGTGVGRLMPFYPGIVRFIISPYRRVSPGLRRCPGTGVVL